MTTKPTPTVIDSDKALARKWYRCIYGFTDRGCPDQREEHTDAHADYLSHMAAEIATAREAWGAPREAVAGLVEAVEGGFAGKHTDDCSDTPGVQTPRYPWGCGCQKRAVDLALERAKEAQG